jgi:hypothetical protein
MAIADLAERAEIDAEAGEKLHPADGEQAGARRHRLFDHIEGNTAVDLRDEVHFHAEPFEIQEGIHVRGKLPVDKQYAVTGLPVQSFGQDIQSF